MSTKSTGNKPQFKSEAEEADWYHSREGREHMKSPRQKSAGQENKLIVDEKISLGQSMDLLNKTGKRVVLRKGANVTPTGPAILQKLVERVRAKQTQAISLRIPTADVEAAKRMAEQAGIGYQTLLKQIISDALRGA